MASSEIFLIDGSSFLFRAYYQSINQDQKYNFRAADNLPTGGVRTFLTKMLQFREKGAMGIMPTHILVAFDISRDGWRRDMYPLYKSNRESPPDDLKTQMPYMRHAVEALGMKYLEIDRYEADDILATYARLGVEKGFNVTLISGDKDIMQLVRDGVKFYDSASGTPGKSGYRPERYYDELAVQEVWEGLKPHQIPEGQALVGDKADDIPGVPGIGLKIAAELISEFGSIDNLLKNADRIKQASRRQKVIENKEVIEISLALAKLDDHAPVTFTIDNLAVSEIDFNRLASFSKALDFPAILKKACKQGKLDANLIVSDPRFVAETTSNTRSHNDSPPIDRSSYQITNTVDRLKTWEKVITEIGTASLYFLTEKENIVGLGVSAGPNKATYIPVGHEEIGTLFGGRFDGQMEVSDIKNFVNNLKNNGVTLVGHDIKTNWSNLGFDVLNSKNDDIMLMSYSLYNGISAHSLERLSIQRLSYHLANIESLTGSGKTKVLIAGQQPEQVLPYLAEWAEVIWRLYEGLRHDLEQSPAEKKIYDTLEMPMTTVLSYMENNGVLVDLPLLSQLSKEFTERMSAHEKAAYSHAGMQFMISSPKQVGDVLFDVLGLPGGKKTASGQWETRADILDDLSRSGVPVAQEILSWRQIAKLKSTYADALQSHAKNGRVHTTMSLAATPTARLTSVNPNLQNIPVRTEDGRRIRQAFIVEENRQIVSADYSQVELRLLAHIADVPELKQAFADGLDIHAKTASEIFNVPIEGMPAEIRRNAKAINFGIVYGISAFGLSNQLGISVSEAGDYINRYFKRFPGILGYMNDVKSSLSRDGYVQTIFGRKIHFPRYNELKGNDKSQVDRAAINAPIQGSAADVIRKAMIRIPSAIDGFDAKMILQVHDELIFDVAKSDLDAVIPVIKNTMENACSPDVNMSVTLVADVNSGNNWDEAH